MYVALKKRQWSYLNELQVQQGEIIPLLLPSLPFNMHLIVKYE